MASSMGKNSCLMNCNDVAAKLLRALQSNDIKKFHRLLEDAEPEAINKHHECPHYATCLQLACLDGQAEFVALLIKHGAEMDTYNTNKSTRALHMACYNAHHDCVELLLKAGADVNSRDGFGSRTPLHVLLCEWKELEDSPTIEFPTVPIPIASKFAKCFQLLLDHPKVELEAKTDSGQTPLELAVSKQNVFAIKTLIRHGAKVNARVREAAREMQMPENEDLINLIAQQDQSPGELNPIDEIRGMIFRKDHVQLQKLLRSLTGPSSDHLDDKNRSLTCVQYCIKEGSVECLQALLDAGADPNLSTKLESRPPIILAAYYGNAQMLKRLLAYPRTDINAFKTSRQTALHNVVLGLRKDSSKYLKCLSILLESKAININSPDHMGNTALHYAALIGVEEVVLLLLHHGASLGSKNCLNETPIKNILPSTLETFLDECMEQSKDVGSLDYYITFKYNFLASQEEPRKQAKSCKRGNSIPETASPSQNVSNSEHTKGGCNPESVPLVAVVSCNSIPETASPSQNVSNSEHTKGDCYPESETLWYLSCSSRHKYLLRHPVVTCFLLLKWHKIQRFFYLNLAFFVLTVAMLTAYVLLWEQTTDPQILLSILWYLLAILVAILFLREFFQFGITPMRYLCCTANYLEFGMIFNTAMILGYSGESESVRHYAAMAVICAYISLMLLLGRHPKWSLLIEAFTCFTRSFRNLLLWYSILIFGFILSFHILFKSPTSSNTDESPANGTTSKPAQNNEIQNFQTLPLTIFKMVAMMTGEMDFNDLPFHMSPVISRLIFVVFVFLIPVVLLNLLNGFAVSDTHAIYSEAETFKYANLVQLVSYTEMTESILLGHHPSLFLFNYPPFSWVCLLPDANCCRKVFMQFHSTLLFDRRLPDTNCSTRPSDCCLPTKAYTVYPNHPFSRASRKGVIDTPKCTCHSSFLLPDEIIEAACERLKAMHGPKESTYLANEREEKQGELRETVATSAKTQELAIHALKDQFDELKQEIKSLSENQVEIMRLLQRADTTPKKLQYR